MNLFNIHREYYLIKYLVILGWLSCWFSIGINPEFFNQYGKFKELNFENHNYHSLITFLRGIGNLVFFPILSFILLKLITQNRIILKAEFFFLALSFLFFIQGVALILTENPNINIYYLISSLNIIIICIVIKNYFFKNELILFFNINLIILICIFVLYGIIYIKIYFEYDIYLYGAWGKANTSMFAVEVPRPTGLSRTALIILIITSLLDKKKNNFYKLNFILTTMCVFFILGLGSRTIILIYLLFIVFYFLNKKIENIKNIFIDLCKFFLIPITLIILLNTFEIQSYKLKLKSETSNKPNVNREFPKLETSNLDKFSSGRLNDWKSILKKNKKVIYGHGVMGARYLINQSASNLILYTYASSGILGLIIITYIYLSTIFFSVSTLIKKNNFYFKNYKLISSLCLAVLMLRSILETSFGIFGIDLILFCFFVTIISFKNGK